jgi:hypothetical protein
MSRGMKKIIEKERYQLKVTMASEKAFVRFKSAYLYIKAQVTIKTAMASTRGTQIYIAMSFVFLK